MADWRSAPTPANGLASGVGEIQAPAQLRLKNALALT